MTSDDPQYEQSVDWYHNYVDSVGWNNLGEVLGTSNAQAAYDLGASIQ
jgi:hypothetical protein